MKIHLPLKALVLMLLFCSGVIFGQDSKSSFRTKGYLLIAAHEEIVFFPDSSAASKFSLKDVEKTEGIRVIGNASYNYDIYRINKIAKPITCKVTFAASKDSSYIIDYNFQLLPVTATLTHNPGLSGKESGFTFEKDGQKYIFKYSDNFDYLLNDIVPLGKSQLAAFKKYKE